MESLATQAPREHFVWDAEQGWSCPMGRDLQPLCLSPCFTCENTEALGSRPGPAALVLFPAICLGSPSNRGMGAEQPWGPGEEKRARGSLSCCGGTDT